MHRAPLYWTLIAAGLVFGIEGASAQGFVNNGAAAMNGVSNSASYNAGVGTVSGMENHPADGQLRDENGNLLVVDGLIQDGSQYSRQTGVHQSGAGYGTNTGATAIGNNLNVTVVGSWNTVIVDSEQVNNGDQNAEVQLNGDLNL
jgi:holdfast attachment protein HfaA